MKEAYFIRLESLNINDDCLSEDSCFPIYLRGFEDVVQCYFGIICADDLDGLIRQVLTAFLTLVSLDPENRAFVEEAYFRAMRTYSLAPTYSPLKSITWEDVMRIIVDMLKNLDLRASNVEDKPAQESFLYRLLAELTKPESTEDDDVPVLHAKASNLVELPLQRFQTIGAYISAAKKILHVSKYLFKAVLLGISKFFSVFIDPPEWEPVSSEKHAEVFDTV